MRPGKDFLYAVIIKQPHKPLYSKERFVWKMSLLLSGGKCETKPKIFRKENIFLSSALKETLNSQESNPSNNRYEGGMRSLLSSSESVRNLPCKTSQHSCMTCIH